MDAQFDVGNGVSAESDGNQMANAGEYTRYEILVLNTGATSMKDTTQCGRCLEEIFAFTPAYARGYPLCGITNDIVC